MALRCSRSCRQSRNGRQLQWTQRQVCCRLVLCCASNLKTRGQKKFVRFRVRNFWCGSTQAWFWGWQKTLPLSPVCCYIGGDSLLPIAGAEHGLSCACYERRLAACTRQAFNGRHLTAGQLAGSKGPASAAAADWHRVLLCFTGPGGSSRRISQALPVRCRRSDRSNFGGVPNCREVCRRLRYRPNDGQRVQCDVCSLFWV